MNTFCTWHCANASLLPSSSPSDLAPLPEPGSDGLKPSTEFGPVRQRLDQLSSGVMNPSGNFVLLMWYLGCDLARRVLQGALCRIGREYEVVVGERLRHRVHAAVAADAVVQEHATVAARASG